MLPLRGGDKGDLQELEQTMVGWLWAVMQQEKRREEWCNADTAEQGIHLGIDSPRDFTCSLAFADRTSCCFLIN